MFDISQTNMIILLVLGCVAYYWITNQNKMVMGSEMANNNQNNEVELNNEEVEQNQETEPEPKQCDTCNDDGEKSVDNTFQPVAGSVFDTVSSF